MKNITRHVGILSAERIVNTRMGNPQYKCEVDGWQFYTKPNSAHATSLENDIGKRVEVYIGTHRGKPTLHSLKGLAVDDGDAAYVDAQFDKILHPRMNHTAGVLCIRGSTGGTTHWLDISAAQLDAIREILKSSPRHN